MTRRTLVAATLLLLLLSSGRGSPAGASPPYVRPVPDTERLDAAQHGGAKARQPPAEILGIRLGMSEAEVERRLHEVGERVETQPGSETESVFKQLWKLRDPRFESVLVRFDPGHRVKWISAYAREGRPRLRYSDVADTTLAKRTGRYIYTWTVESVDGEPGYVLTARGTSPSLFSSLSLAAFTPRPRPAEASPDTAR